MSICVPRWYWEEMQEFAISINHEKDIMNETKTIVAREDFDAAMRLLGLLVDPDIAIMSVHIAQGVVTAEYAQRVRVMYEVGYSDPTRDNGKPDPFERHEHVPPTDPEFQIKRGGPQWPVTSPPADPIPSDGQAKS